MHLPLVRHGRRFATTLPLLGWMSTLRLLHSRQDTARANKRRSPRWWKHNRTWPESLGSTNTTYLMRTSWHCAWPSGHLLVSVPIVSSAALRQPGPGHAIRRVNAPAFFSFKKPQRASLNWCSPRHTHTHTHKLLHCRTRCQLEQREQRGIPLEVVFYFPARFGFTAAF
jgi:hypothetical protein